MALRYFYGSALLLLATLLLVVSCGSPRGSGDGDSADADVGADVADDIATLPDGGEGEDGVDVDAGALDADSEDEPDAECRTLGCPCVSDDECVSGYCLDGGAFVGRVCSELCGGTCSQPGYDCVLLVNSGGDAARVCVPSARSYCTECESDRDCGRIGDFCVEQMDGDRCATACGGDVRCPEGATCDWVDVGGDLVQLCVPESGACDPLTCEPDWVDCDGVEANGCERAPEDLNACGGCDALDQTIGAACGPCASGQWTCDGTDAVICDGADESSVNACGGCEELVGVLGEPCGVCDTGVLACDSTDAYACAGENGDALNACGGCDELEETVGTACGTCGTGQWACDGTDAVACEGANDDALNACGGCGVLDQSVGSACGTCGSGEWTCSGVDGVRCAGDDGEAARNACGGCATLTSAPGVPCGPCGDGAWACSGEEAVTCAGATPDTDGDGTCDDTDICAGHDDDVDSDGDGVPNGCDICPGNPDDVDGDGDGVPDGCDECLVGPDGSDSDGDGVPNACDCDLAGCNANASCAESRTGTECTCLPDYIGDGETCTLIDCGTIAQPSYGETVLTGTTIRSTATTSCDTGWTLQGTEVRTCLASGSWSGERATCYRPPGDVYCACDRIYSVGDRVVSQIDCPEFNQPCVGIGRLGTVIAGSNRSAPYDTNGILVDWDGFSGGHTGRCDWATCGACNESSGGRYWQSCESIRPAGP